MSAIANLQIHRVGQDLNGDSVVTDNNGTWTGPGDTDTLFDGIVLVANAPANLAAISKTIIAPNFLFTA